MLTLSGSDIDQLSLTAGSHVTNWGESTFIPVGANGFNTNALRFTALRVPGASIRDALLPTEQITFRALTSMVVGHLKHTIK